MRLWKDSDRKPLRDEELERRKIIKETNMKK